MSNEQTNPENADQNKGPEHKSWITHIVEEIGEEIDELIEEAQQGNPDEFPMVGDWHVHHVHDHHHDHDKKEGEEKK